MVTGGPSQPVDPVRARRQRIGRLAQTGKRIGYALFGVAIVAFVVGMSGGFPSPTVTIVLTSLAVGSAVLAPSIVVAYGVRAAEREDRTT